MGQTPYRSITFTTDDAASIHSTAFYIHDDTIQTRSIWKMLGPFATASRRTPPVLHCHSPGVATAARRHCRTPPAHRCPRQRQQQRQRVTEGTAMAP